MRTLLFRSPKPVFLKLFYSIAPFSHSTRHFRPPSLIKQTQCSKFKEFYLKKLEIIKKLNQAIEN